LEPIYTKFSSGLKCYEVSAGIGERKESRSTNLFHLIFLRIPSPFLSHLHTTETVMIMLSTYSKREVAESLLHVSINIRRQESKFWFVISSQNSFSSSSD